MPDNSAFSVKPYKGPSAKPAQPVVKNGRMRRPSEVLTMHPSAGNTIKPGGIKKVNFTHIHNPSVKAYKQKGL